MTIPVIVPDGARWRCVDLHLHSPGVPSFRPGPGADPSTDAGRAVLVQRFVQALAAAGIEVACMTDYQGPREPWFAEITAAARSRGITVLPGAELSVRSGGGKGLHLLLICSSSVTSDEIIDAIRYEHHGGGAMLFQGRGQHDDVNLRQPLSVTVASLRARLNCVVLAPHARDGNGLLREVGPEQSAELVRAGLVDGFDQCEDADKSLQGTGLFTSEDLSRVACTLSSDPKDFSHIGRQSTSDGRRRMTWLKLSRVDAPAIRLALHDPQSRVLTREPEAPHHARLRSVEVEGGFLSGLTINFSDDLTCLIGGRGAGKSAVLETIRYGLDVGAYVDRDERLALVRYALGSGGVVRLVVERAGPQPHRYEVTRVLDQQPRVRDLVSETEVEIAPIDVFGDAPPVILLQREIQAVSRDGSFRRRLLDEIVGEEARAADRAVAQLLERLRANSRQLDEVERRLGERDEREAQLRRIDADIDYYQQQGVAEKLTRQSRLGSDGARVERARGSAEVAQEALREALHVSQESLTDVARALAAGESDDAAALHALVPEVERVAAQVERLLEEATQAVDGLQVRFAALADSWPDRLRALDEDLRHVQEQLRTSRLDPDTYLDVVRQRTVLQPLVAELARQEAVQADLLVTRRQLGSELQEARRRAFGLRRAAALAVSSQMAARLLVSVEYLGERSDFRERLGTLLKGSGVSGAAIDTLAAAEGTDGIELASAVRRGAPALVERFQLSVVNADRVIAWLTSDLERLRAVEVLAPQDSIRVALVVDGVAKPLAELSGGQRATAVLLLLFAQGQRPLLLDQPEDDLDNRFIYDDVVALIRAEKGVADVARRRQIIAATHNANIPVNGDAELVVSLEEVNRRVSVRARSSIDDGDVRQEIRTVLEGGEEAFRRRAEKYGGVDR